MQPIAALFSLALVAATREPLQDPPKQVPEQAAERAADQVTEPVAEQVAGQAEQAPVDAPSVSLSLTLEQAIETALANDLSLEAEEIQGEIARLRFEGSWGRFDPLFSASANWSRVENFPQLFGNLLLNVSAERLDLATGINYPITTGGAFGLSFQQSSDDIAGNSPNPSFRDTILLSFNQPLLRGGGTDYATSNQRELDFRAKKQLERIRQARQDVIKNVIEAYWDLAAAIEQLLVAEETLALGREQQDQNERRLAAGVGTEVEVLQAQANVAQRVEQRLLRDTAVHGAADRLKAILYPGTEIATWEREMLPVTPLPEPEVSGIPEWQSSMQTALEWRAELRQQRLEIDAIDEELVRTRSERKPQLDFAAGIAGDSLTGSEGSAFAEAVDFDPPRYQAGLTFSFPIGNRTARYSERAARAAIRAARITYDQLESQIVAEVRSATRNAFYSAEAVRAAEVSRELARRQLAAEQARYREGLSTNYQVLEFQQQLAESLYSYTLARANFAKAMTTLIRAQGRIGERQ